jgi:hypothetical protein
MFLEEKNYNENPKNFLMPFYQALISKLEAWRKAKSNFFCSQPLTFNTQSWNPKASFLLFMAFLQAQSLMFGTSHMTKKKKENNLNL